MKQNRIIAYLVSLSIVILLNIVILAGLLSDSFPKSNKPEKTTVATDREETIEEESTGEESTEAELTTEEVSVDEPATSEPTTEAVTMAWVEREIPYDEAETLLHTFSWGEGDGQLGYWENPSPSGSNSYPRAFAAENGMIYVADNANKRFVIYDGSHYMDMEYMDKGTTYSDSTICYQNGWLGVVTNLGMAVNLYSKDNGRRISIKAPDEIERMGTIQDILEIGDTYIVCKVLRHVSGTYGAYKYDWIKDSVESVGLKKTSISVSDDLAVIIGEADSAVYYYQRHYYGDPGERKCDYTVSCETEDLRLYTVLYNMSISRGSARFYLSTDGRLYVMKHYEDRVEISEIKLGTEIVE